VKHLLYLGNKLALQGYNPTGIDTLGPLLAGEGYHVRYASSYKSKVFRFLEMLVKVSFITRLDYVLLDTYSTTNFWYAFWMSRLCRLRKLPYIPILHGGNLPKRWETHPRYCALLFGQAYQNICPSPYLEAAFQKVGCPNLMLIPNALSEQYTFKARPLPRPKLLWVRSFASIYNPTMALTVLTSLRKTYPEAELCMVGPDQDGSEQLLKNKAMSLGLPITFMGKMAKTDWIRMAENFDFFINTSHFDNTPVSVVEAMHLGLVVVSTSVGGMPFLIEHQQSGWLVPDADSEAMSAAISYLLAHPAQYAQLASNAKAKVATFDWKLVQSHWHSILK
jgi:L-malate glycosyltransferase